MVQAITIQNGQVDATMTDFPFLVTRDHFDDSAVSPHDCSSARTDGGDLRFYSDAAMTTRLPCEVVHFAHDSTHAADDALIEVWVKVASVSSSVDTTIYVSYDQGETAQPAVSDTYGRDAVWADYGMVMHCSEDPSGTAPQMTDSTGNGNDGTSAGTMLTADLINGKIGKCLQLDGSNDRIDVAEDAGISWGSTESFTKMIWFARDADTGSLECLIQQERTHLGIGDGTSGTDDNELYSAIQSGSGHAGTTSIATDSSWHMATLTYDNTACKVYLDDALDASVTRTLGSQSGKTNRFGMATTSLFPLQGRIDEIRITDGALTLNEIATHYNCHNAPATFASAGTPTAI